MGEEGRLRELQFRIWLAILGVSTLIIGAAYAMAQQSTRLAADDLPLVAAQTAKQSLDNGTKPKDALPAPSIDLRHDAGVFIIVTDAAGNIRASSASLDNSTPLPPRGVFAYTAAHGSDHFTWQPTKGVRLATRVLPYNNGYVISGQSLKPAEDRINNFGLLALAAWLAIVGWTTITLLLTWPLVKSLRRGKPKPTK